MKVYKWLILILGIPWFNNLKVHGLFIQCLKMHTMKIWNLPLILTSQKNLRLIHFIIKCILKCLLNNFKCNYLRASSTIPQISPLGVFRDEKCTIFGFAKILSLPHTTIFLFLLELATPLVKFIFYSTNNSLDYE